MTAIENMRTFELKCRKEGKKKKYNYNFGLQNHASICITIVKEVRRKV